MTLTAVPDAVPASLPEKFWTKLNTVAPVGYGLTGAEIESLVNKAREKFLRIDPTPGQLVDAVESMARQFMAEKAIKTEQASTLARLKDKAKTYLETKGVKFRPFVMDDGGKFASELSYRLHYAWGDLIDDIVSMLGAQERLVELRRRVGEVDSSHAMLQHGVIGEMETAEREAKVRTARGGVSIEIFTSFSTNIHAPKTREKIRELVTLDEELTTFRARVNPQLEAARNAIEAFFKAEEEALTTAKPFINLFFRHGCLCDDLGIKRQSDALSHDVFNVKKLIAGEFSAATFGRDTSCLPTK